MKPEIKSHKAMRIFLISLFSLIILFTLITVMAEGVLADNSFFADHSFDSVTLNLSMSSKLTITKFSSGFIKNIILYYYLVPAHTDDQQVLSLTTYPNQNSELEKSENERNGQQHITYNYLNPQQGQLNYGYNAIVKIKYKPIEISKTIAYPYKFNNDTLNKYLSPTDKIDSNNPAIISLAKKLKDNSTDYFSVVFNTAKWVNSNVKYDLNSVTADVTKNASWVLQNRYGVCDEITVLFMALLRANGIPARFVSGIAFTNSPLFTSSWGFHSWAEVYFPDSGWVPFDVTFGEYGSVDPLRVVFIKSEYAVKPASSYSAQEYDSDIQLSDSNPSVKIINWTERNDNSDLNYNFSLMYDKINSNSKDILFMNITNPSMYYRIILLQMLASSNIKYDNKTYLFYLKPHDSAKFTTMIQPKGEFKNNYQYTIPIVFSINNIETKPKYLKISNSFNNYDASFFNMYKNDFGIRTYSRNSPEVYEKNMPFYVNCTNKEKIFVGDTLNISCSFVPIKNYSSDTNNSFTVCAEKQCNNIYYHGKEFNLSFSKKVSSPGYQSIPISINALSFSKTIYFQGISKPKLIFSDLIYPDNVKFDKEYKINFKFHINNSQIINKCKIEGFINDRTIVNQLIDDAIKEYSFTLPPLNSYILKSGKNTLRLTAQCYDSLGNTYNKTISKTIRMKNLSWWQYIEKFFYNLLS